MSHGQKTVQYGEAARNQEIDKFYMFFYFHASLRLYVWLIFVLRVASFFKGKWLCETKLSANKLNLVFIGYNIFYALEGMKSHQSDIFLSYIK
jgi:hypothetical protein